MNDLTYLLSCFTISTVILVCGYGCFIEMSLLKSKHRERLSLNKASIRTNATQLSKGSKVSKISVHNYDLGSSFPSLERKNNYPNSNYKTQHAQTRKLPGIEEIEPKEGALASLAVAGHSMQTCTGLNVNNLNFKKDVVRSSKDEKSTRGRLNRLSSKTHTIRSCKKASKVRKINLEIPLKRFSRTARKYNKHISETVTTTTTCTSIFSIDHDGFIVKGLGEKFSNFKRSSKDGIQPTRETTTSIDNNVGSQSQSGDSFIIEMEGSGFAENDDKTLLVHRDNKNSSGSEDSEGRRKSKSCPNKMVNPVPDRKTVTFMISARSTSLV